MLQFIFISLYRKEKDKKEQKKENKTPKKEEEKQERKKPTVFRPPNRNLFRKHN